MPQHACTAAQRGRLAAGAPGLLCALPPLMLQMAPWGRSRRSTGKMMAMTLIHQVQHSWTRYRCWSGHGCAVTSLRLHPRPWASAAAWRFQSLWMRRPAYDCWKRHGKLSQSLLVAHWPVTGVSLTPTLPAAAEDAAAIVTTAAAATAYTTLPPTQHPRAVRSLPCPSTLPSAPCRRWRKLS